MPTTTETVSNGKTATKGLRPAPGASPPASGRRRQVPWIVTGVLLVVGCALAFGVASVRASHGEVVLVVAQPVPAGQVLQASDLRAVRLSPPSGLQPVQLSSEANVVGRPVAVALVPGTLLTPADVGSGSAGSAASDVVALALKAGGFPPSLGPGQSVEVVPVPGTTSAGSTSSVSSSSGSGQLSLVRAVVVGVEAAPVGSSAAAVVSLQVLPSDASEVASLGAAGDAVLVVVPSGSGS